MAKIVIIGWYGTETIGDRAILAGLFDLLAESFADIEISLGSFYKVLTERTLLEDMNFYNKISKQRIKGIRIFDSSILAELNKAIAWSDIVAVGGGPLAEIDQMYMLQYAFCKARNLHKRTALLGCGVGPLVSGAMIRSFYDIVRLSDLKIFRDDNLRGMDGGKEQKYAVSCDPAVFAARFYLSEHQKENRTNDYVSVNFREIISGVVEDIDMNSKSELFVSLLGSLLDRTDYNISLVPMHSFSIGGDDRYTLNRIAGKLNSQRVIVQNIPLNLEETMGLYYNPVCALGMRFHAMVLQTILNGKNYILDYTFPTTGKTTNFLKQFNLWDDYQGRYISLLSNNGESFEIDPDCRRIHIPSQIIAEKRAVYVHALKELL